MDKIKKEPTLEKYGLDSVTYENYGKQKVDLEKSFIDYKNETYTTFYSILETLLIFAVLFGVFFTIEMVSSGNYFLMFAYWLIFWYFLTVSNNNNNKIKEKEREINKKIEFIKDKVFPFEDDSIKYCLDYVDNFHKNYLYKKRSGKDEFEVSLLEFSNLINEFEEIRDKLIFKRHLPSFYKDKISEYKNYLFSRKINHAQQKSTKVHFSSFKDVSLVDRKTGDKIQSIMVNPEPGTNNEGFKNGGKYINSEEKEGFLFDLLDIFNDEIDNANNSTTENKNIINTIDVISPYKKYSTPRKIDWESVNKNKTITGMMGEEIAMEIEQNYLKSIDREDLAVKVRHASKMDGDGLGYDILSFFLDGQEKYIEVKSSENSISNSFNITDNELDFMKRNKDNYQIYRLFNVGNIDNDPPTLKIDTASDILNFKKITPSQYVVKM